VQVWFKNRRAKCRQQQKAAEQVSKTASHAHHHHHHQQVRPSSAGSLSNASAPVPAVRGLPAMDGDGGTSKSTGALASSDDDDDRLIYRHHGSGGGLLVASSAAVARPSCGWVPAASLLRPSSDTFPGPYRVGPRLHSGPTGYPSMFASRSAGYPPYGGAGTEQGGYAGAGWSVAVTQDAYCNGAAAGGDSGDAGVQFLGSTSSSYGAVPLFLSSAYDHEHAHQHHHIQQYHHQHQQQKDQLDDDDLDDEDTTGDYDSETSRRGAVQSADDKDWIKYQPL